MNITNELNEVLNEVFPVLVIIAGLALMGTPMVADIFGELATSVWVYWGIGLAVMVTASAWIDVRELFEQLDALDTGCGCDCEVELRPVEVKRETGDV